MMAVPSNRSPSPLSSRPNPHSRNSESNSTIRRSFSGNPFPRPSVLTNPKSFNPVTPANSPAGFGRRVSVGKEGTGQLQSCDEKENDKDQNLKSVKVRSPANGSKNFMSPTISAASKFTPPPRKKPLVERNELVRTSISLSDGKATFFSAFSSENTEDLVNKSELLTEQKEDEGCLESTLTHLDQKEAVLECPPASRAMKRVTFAELPSSDSERASGLRADTVTTDSDCLNVESDPKNKPYCFSVSPVIAPLDADPLIPPYDPKTNYLSPRPQFLHYKPNPRIEVLLNTKEKGVDSEVKRLEDSFTLESSSETFSDADGNDESISEDSHKDSEDSSSAETEEAEMKEEELDISESSLLGTDIALENYEEEELRLSEKLDISTPISHEIPCEIVEGKAKEKGRFFTSLKFVSLLLLVLIGAISISVTNSPVRNSSVLKTLNLSELQLLPPGVADSSQANFDAFAGRFKQLSFDSFSHLSMLIKNLGGHDKLSPLQFINLTDIEKSILVGGYLQASESSFPICPTAREASDNVIGGKGSEKFKVNFEKDDLEDEEEDGESLPFEEETSVGAISGPTAREISENVVGAKESEKFTANFERNYLEDEEEDGESLPFEEETFAGAISDDTSETESDGEVDLGTQELTSTPAPIDQTEEPEFETVWSQHEAASDAETELKFNINAEDYVGPVSEAPEAKSEEKAPETQLELGDAIDLGPEARVESSSVDFNSESTSDVTPLIVEQRDAETVEPPVDLVSGARVESSSVDINLESSSYVTPFIGEHRDAEIVKPPIGESQNMLSVQHIAGGTSIILVLISAAAYVYMKRSKASNQNPVVHTDQLLSKKIPSPSILEKTHQERPSSQNWPTEVYEMGESCPSEMSSFRTSSSYNRLRRSENEAQSQERKPRKHSKRESLASSSEYSMGGTSSYGSFTTYEKIQSKNGSGDDEIMTPVRRSSRIRNLVTSP